IKAGVYELDLPLYPSELLGKLTGGRQKLRRITIPEGLTIREMDALLADRGVLAEGEFERYCRNPDNAGRYGIEAESLEGFLFPDTYLVPYDISVDKLVDVMVGRFREVFDPNLVADAERLGMSILEAVTLASMIEKETALDEEKPLISAVFHNRLKRGMKLQCDPTVIYGLEDFDGNLTREDLKNPHPYNTYVHSGLPPGPICNPGRTSLVAAVRPADVDYLYFVAKRDGSHHFSSTYSEHRRAVLKYQIQKR
ncbi:MAG TPA: endolytic transglycosylase MltG, partial [Proteobacteria bacterium]|nr:endolytic transglycosylase MltG [Pseudomonadota bacterium]